VIRGVHHVGIAVRDLSEAISFYERVLGLEAERVPSPPGSTLTFAMVRLPGAEIELLAEAAAETPISRFLATRGPGVHHVALEVGDIVSAMAATTGRGAQALSETPLPGVDDTLTCFFHPRSTMGVLFEYVQPAPPAGEGTGGP
jgi:methylmalonyl-CoA/ethylmalonyl-CoA epimerase